MKSLPRVIGVVGLGLMAVNFIVGSGIFGLPGLVAAQLGAAALLAYLVVIVLIFLVGLCFAETGSRVASTGGLYAYAHVAFGPVVGGIAGTLSWTANCVLSNAAVSNLLVDTLAAAIPRLGNPFPRTAILAVLYSFFYAPSSPDALKPPCSATARASRAPCSTQTMVSSRAAGK